MGHIEDALRLAVKRILSNHDYERSFAFYRLWIDIKQTYHQIPSDPTLDDIWNYRATGLINPTTGDIIQWSAHLVPRLASDAESDHLLGPQNAGLQGRLCARSLREFFINNLAMVQHKQYGRGSDPTGEFYTDTNLVAHWVNLGQVEEAAIRNHILQSLIANPKLHDHQVDALIILFQLAGATFAAYADPSVVDRCFELIGDHYTHGSPKWGLVQRVVVLRERGWEGFPPPPVLTIGNRGQIGMNRNDPVITSLGLPNRDLEPQIPQPPPPEPTAISGAGAVPGSPIVHSPSISVSSLSDFTITDTPDDEDLHDPTTITPHDTFYLDDGNVEVLCGSTLFRVHTSILSFHSPVLRRMFARTSQAAAESPNGCPRIPSSDTATDFATLLKVIYFPGFPERNKVPDFATFSSLLRITTKYEFPAIRSQIFEAIREAYPEAFEGLDPSKTLGENVFSGPTPHPNAVLNLFVQQKLTSALPMAYYMAVRRGPDSLIDEWLPASARLPPKILQVAIKGLIALREMELRETHRLIQRSRGSRLCSRPDCPSHNPTCPAYSEAHQKIVDRVTDSVHSGTKLLQVLSLREFRGGNSLGFCEGCVEAWEVGHADVRKKAWAVLPDVFGLRG